MIAVVQVDPEGMGCLREQMCHPLATVVFFPQWPGGSRLASERTDDNGLRQMFFSFCLGPGCTLAKKSEAGRRT